MTELLAWIWAPAVLYALLLGLGLLADGVLRTELPGGLLAPVGLALAVVVVTSVYRCGGTAAVAAPLTITGALVGFSSSRSVISPARSISVRAGAVRGRPSLVRQSGAGEEAGAVDRHARHRTHAPRRRDVHRLERVVTDSPPRSGGAMAQPNARLAGQDRAELPRTLRRRLVSD